MVKQVALLAVLWAVLPGTAVAASLMVPPVPSGESVVSLDVAVNEVRYEVPAGRVPITREIVALSWGYESFFASLGSVVHTDFDGSLALDNLPLSGESGYLFAVGARGALWRAGAFAVNGHAQIHVLNEKVVAAGVIYEMQSQELLAGICAAWEPPGWRAYAGVETVPYTHIEMELPGYEKIERSDYISIHVGGGLDLGPVVLSADGQFLGTAGLRIGIGYAF
jgi:hypothetical protein